MPSSNNDPFTVVPVMKFWTTDAKVISVGQKFLETKSKHCTYFANKESYLTIFHIQQHARSNRAYTDK